MLAVVSVALLLIVVDMTVLYTTLPVLTHAQGASASARQWSINAYPLVVSGLLLDMGTRCESSHDPIRLTLNHPAAR